MSTVSALLHQGQLNTVLLANKVPLRLNAAAVANPFDKYSSTISGNATLWNGSAGNSSQYKIF
jgi:hypothetical protein